MNFFNKLTQGLTRTKKQLTQKIEDLVVAWKGPDSSLLEQMEEILIAADIGVSATGKLLDRIRMEKCRDGEAVKRCLKEGLLSILTKGGLPEVHSENALPRVVLVIGVNGSGKTTTVGKMAALFQEQGKKVVLAAGDTFRAAAIEQLEIWGRHTGADVIKHRSGSDPSAVVFDAVAAAKARGADVLIVDTAGRLHTKANLMEELKKVTRVLGREHPGSPHEVLLVLDATSGQNALAQARLFHKDIGVTGVILTKLDGTAKGGIIVSIVEELKIPVTMIGVGEGVDDLQPFNAREFVEALLN